MFLSPGTRFDQVARHGLCWSVIILLLLGHFTMVPALIRGFCVEHLTKKETYFIVSGVSGRSSIYTDTFSPIEANPKETDSLSCSAALSFGQTDAVSAVIPPYGMILLFRFVPTVIKVCYIVKTRSFYLCRVSTRTAGKPLLPLFPPFLMTLFQCLIIISAT